MSTLVTLNDLASSKFMLIVDTVAKAEKLSISQSRRIAIGILADVRSSLLGSSLKKNELMDAVGITEAEYFERLIECLASCSVLKIDSNDNCELSRYTYHQNHGVGSYIDNVDTHHRIPCAVAPVRLFEPPDALVTSFRDQKTQSQDEINGKTENNTKKRKKSDKNSKKTTKNDELSLDDFLMESVREELKGRQIEIIEPPAERAKNEYWKVFEHYSIRYSENMNGEGPPKWNKRDFGACKVILQKFGIDRVLEIIDRYFTYKPNNSIRDGYPFSNGYSSVCFLSGEIDADIKNPRRLFAASISRKEIDKVIKIDKMVSLAFGVTNEH